MDVDNTKDKEILYSQVVKAGKRTYFLDVKETKNGEKYITITESRKIFRQEEGKFVFEKNKMFLYKEDFTKFIEGLENVIRFAETGEMTEDSQIIDDSDFSFDIDSIFDESELKNI
ncbi:MAG: DUF3276 family protein [Bacteroidales bacterium]|nr:DUF3276 family protein [Bacteroidales bacterium]